MYNRERINDTYPYGAKKPAMVMRGWSITPAGWAVDRAHNPCAVWGS